VNRKGFIVLVLALSRFLLIYIYFRTVKNGGHDIPTEDIIRRNTTSFKHLYEYAHMINNLILIDNSEDNGEIVLEINDGVITFEARNLPQWALPVAEQFKKI
jgi:predicted ABC-type ATPase